MLKYTSRDLLQAVIGAFFASLWWFSLRGPPGPEVEQAVGLGVTLIWFFILFKSFRKPDGEHFFMNIIVVYSFCVLMSIIFKLATWEQLIANPFGNTAMIVTWEALPVALIFDKFDITSVFSRYYTGGRN